jgi:hypothetical protein
VKFDSSHEYDAKELFESAITGLLSELDNLWKQYFEELARQPFEAAVFEPASDDHSDDAINELYDLLEEEPLHSPLINIHITCAMLLRALELGACTSGWRVLMMANGNLWFLRGNLDSKKEDLDAFEPFAHKAAISEKNSKAGRAPRPLARKYAEPGDIAAVDIEAEGLKRMRLNASPESRANAVRDLSQKHRVTERHVRDCLTKAGWPGRKKQTEA